MERLLVVDDERAICALVETVLAGDELEVHVAATGGDGLRVADEITPDIVLLDLRLPDGNGMAVLQTLKVRQPEVAVIIITGFGQIETIIEAVKNGATDFLEKPFDANKLRFAVGRALDEVKARRQLQRLRDQEEKQYGADRLIGESESTRKLRELVRQLGQSEAHTLLVHGESGTGKELVARGLHHSSRRHQHPFVEVNCAAIPDTLFESELFGHEKGAFTDARTTKKGLLEIAEHGTLFLDEVSEMTPALQAKFLRCLQERVFRRVGGTRDISADLRIIAATNRPLEALAGEGRFRADLFYRLSVIPITIDPLRERTADVMPLARHFLVEANRQFHKTIKGFAPETEQALVRHPWPGNVRELKNLVERVVILGTSDVIRVHELPPPFTVEGAGPRNCESSDNLHAVERAHIRRVLRDAGGNKSRAARMLGITRQTLRKKLEQTELVTS